MRNLQQVCVLSLVEQARRLARLVVFSDSKATVALLRSCSSGSPQMNAIGEWLFERCPRLQLPAVHQPGKRNGAADGLSRIQGATDVLQEAEGGGAVVVPMPHPDPFFELMYTAAALPHADAFIP